MSTTDFGKPDVIVVGAGNAAACAALAARENGASVIMLEAAPIEDCGGNSRYTAGLMRVAFNGVDDLAQLIPDLTEDEKKTHDFGSYTAEAYYDDMGRITQYSTDPDLCEILISRSFETLVWLRKKGVRFQPSYGRQSYKIDDKRYKFWGGLAAETWGGGPGLVENEHKACEREGIRIFYETPAVSLITDDDGRVLGVRARHRGKNVQIQSNAVVLACGGFESNAEMRARYLGPGWDLAKVRGTRYNTGQGIKMALDAGAMPYGHWSGCHAVGWDMNAPPFGDLAVGDQFQKHSYPWGIMVNARGERFVDEGADFRNYTYAKYGRVILEQPGMFAWQIFDKKIIPVLRDEYRIKQVTKVRADTLEELVKKLEGVNAANCLREIGAYNKAVRTDIPFNMAIKDGRCTEGLKINKSNWANRVDEAPFEAYAVTCGVTFSFGGVKVSNDAQVEDTAGKPIPGLFAAGEMVGGIFYHNYPGGTGLTSGSVFGKLAGTSAAAYVKRK
ncbi:MAG TPA: FAD-dependent tricarballylate dehydrogenase TcuA [Burkholderiales bacterium]|jgi:tricarballylate dehydrogenase|nr:FAD-dependent tricarballylate dehydrogenase TcuA [Burkholderiales bacterium]